MRRNFPYFLACAAWALIYWGGSSQSRPMLDAMTYGALAKHVLTTGDWTRLHYAAQAYSDFFQHPPLGVWLQALVFRCVGASDLTIRILPSLWAALTLVLVFRWGRRASGRGDWGGWVAFAILLSSTRYVKYSLQFYLDPLQTLLLVAAADQLDVWYRKDGPQRMQTAVGSGFFFGLWVALAFLAKGLPAVVLPCGAAALATLQMLWGKGDGWSRWALGALGGMAWPLLLWIGALDGGPYLVRYWTDSVAGRAQPRSWETLLAPTANLLKQYWPWLAVLPWALWRFARRPRAWAGIDAWPWGLAFGVLLGFSWAGIFLEHYLLPFYPFAAVAVARELAPVAQRFERNWTVAVATLLLGYSLWLGAGNEVHGDAHLSPFRRVTQQGAEACPGLVQVSVSTVVAEMWTGLATALWYTGGDARVEPAPAARPPSGRPEGVVTNEAEAKFAAPGWRVLVREQDWVFLGSPACQ